MVEWIGDFVSNRHAQVTVGEYESEVSEIEYAGIPQGSPLSSLLYVFYNANLVGKKIDRRGGAIGFVDDFNAWVVGADESETTATIQREIIPHAERWARQSGYIRYLSTPAMALRLLSAISLDRVVIPYTAGCIIMLCLVLWRFNRTLR
jgi:hypothetical protein